MFAYPLRVDGIVIGVLDLYRDTPGGWPDPARAEAVAWADAAAETLLRLQAGAWPPTELHPQLTGGTADRAEVHQATGMIAAQTGRTVVDALLLLRARAFTTGRPMLAVARDVLAHRTRFDRDQPDD